MDNNLAIKAFWDVLRGLAKFVGFVFLVLAVFYGLYYVIGPVLIFFMIVGAVFGLVWYVRYDDLRAGRQ